jgi:hypothetical protein
MHRIPWWRADSAACERGLVRYHQARSSRDTIWVSPPSGPRRHRSSAPHGIRRRAVPHGFAQCMSRHTSGGPRRRSPQPTPWWRADSAACERGLLCHHKANHPVIQSYGSPCGPETPPIQRATWYSAAWSASRVRSVHVPTNTERTNEGPDARQIPWWRADPTACRRWFT